MVESSKAVFVSYASQDEEAARRICDALRAAGLEVRFDQSELRGEFAKWSSPEYVEHFIDGLRKAGL